MIRRILVAVDDSSPALAAAEAAVALAEAFDAELQVVAVADAQGDPEAILVHVRSIIERAGRSATYTLATGGPAFEVLLEVAADWEADLVVMGRSDRRRPGVPYVGSQTEHFLEFSELPVLVVPGRREA